MAQAGEAAEQHVGTSTPTRAFRRDRKARRRSLLSVLVCSGLLGATLGVTDGPAGAADGDPTAMLVKDINPGGVDSNPQKFVQVGASLLFVATDPVAGGEWRKTDGTAGGTSLLKDIRPGANSAFIGARWAQAGGSLFFAANDGSSIGSELWKTDGTEAGTVLVKDVNPGTANGVTTGAPFAAVGNTVYFMANDGIHGTELWKSDGTWDGTVMVKDVVAGSANTNVEELAVVGTTLLISLSNGFVAPGLGTELWRSDGTEAGTVLVKDIRPGSSGSSPNRFATAGTTAYFSAYGDSTGQELWKTDGSEAGTVLVKDIAPGSADSFPGQPVVVGSSLYFSADDGTRGTELWKSDGTAAGTVLARDINPGTGSSVAANLTNIAALGSGVVFQASDATNGAELWKSDGTPAGTTLVKDIGAGPASGVPTGFAVSGSTAWFSATDGTVAPASGTELWKSDGTAAGTMLVKDVNPGTGSSSPQFLTAALGSVFFSANDVFAPVNHGVELWRVRNNFAPAAGDDAYSTSVDSPRTVAAPGVLANDTDADGDTLSAGSPSAPANGSVALNADGSFTYTPAPGFSGTDSFTYAASDGVGGPDTATVTITVAGTNQVPVAGPDSYTTTEDTSLTVPAPGVLANDSDGNGDALSAGSASTPAHGTVALNANGSFTYTPALNYNGTDSFTYVAGDGQAGNATGTVVITVSAVNDAPAAVNDDYSTTVDVPITVAAPGVLANDTDAEGAALTSGSASTPAHGSVSLNADGSFTYTASAGFAGIDGFTYVASDGSGGTRTATVNLNIYGPNSVTSLRGSACGYSTTIGLFFSEPRSNGCARPVASTDGTYSPYVSLPASGSPVAITAADPDGATAYLGPGPVFGGRWPSDVNSAPPSGPITVRTQGTPAEGFVTASADIAYNPTPVQCYGDPAGTTNCTAPGGYGPFPVEADSLHVECTATKDGVTGSTTFVNAELSRATTGQGEPIDIVPVPDDPPVNYTAEGVITVVGDFFTAVYNEQVWNADGSLTVTASHLYLHGPTAVGEEIRGQVTCGTSPHAVTPLDVDPPTCRSAVRRNYATMLEDAGVHDTGGIQSITNVQVTNGQVQIGANPGSPYPYLRFVPGQTGPLFLRATRSDNQLPMHWSFDATDVAGNTSHCIGMETAPAAFDDAYAVAEDAPLSVAAPGVLGNDTDADLDPLSAGSATTPAHGTVTLNANGSFTYTPDAGYTGPDTFTYTATDGTGRSASATVALDVGAVNDAPLAVGDAYSTSEDMALTVDAPGLVGNDTDADGDPLTAAKVTDPAHGSVVVNANGSFTYTPAPNYNGPDSFNYKSNDGSLDSNVATVTLAVTAANDTPVAVANAYSTNEDTALTVAAPGVLGNDTDVDGDILTASKVADPAHGSVTVGANGSFTYTPASNYNGPDSFTYKANDGSADSSVVTVSLAVTAANDVPVAVDDTASTTSNAPVTVAPPGVLGNDTDVDGNTLTAGSAGTPATGTVALNANGSFTYTPNAGFVGTDVFTYVVSDGAGGTDTGLVTVTVVAGGPIVSIGSVSVAEGDAGTRPAIFTVSLSAPAVSTVSVNYATANGTATGSSDFTAKSGVVTFAAGITTAKVKVPVLGDTGVEANESFTVVLSAPGGATIVNGTGTGTVVNDDSGAAAGRNLAIGDVSVHEGDAGIRKAVFTVSLSKASTSTVKVNYGTVMGTATNADLTAVAGTLSFAAGVTSMTVAVTIKPGNIGEGNETFSVNLSVPSGATISDGSGRGTIIDDD